eukprot:2758249-Amphidinium_carterae.1
MHSEAISMIFIHWVRPQAAEEVLSKQQPFTSALPPHYLIRSNWKANYPNAIVGRLHLQNPLLSKPSLALIGLSWELQRKHQSKL